MSGEFTGKTALITGGSRGMGRATALRLAREGANVAISYATRHETAAEVVGEIQAHGREALAVACNVALAEDVDRLVVKTRQALGPIDLLVHCGAISNLKTHEELTFDCWQETIDVNLHGAFRVVFAVKDEMIRRQYGRIVTLSSIAALRPRALQIHYATAKAGVIALTRCCAEAFAPHVRINCLAPGLTETEMVHVLPDDRLAELIQATPLKRIGTPHDMAGVIRFLLSDESSFMTGQTLVHDGGRVMLP